jgi:hypothetical protein
MKRLMAYFNKKNLATRMAVMVAVMLLIFGLWSLTLHAHFSGKKNALNDKIEQHQQDERYLALLQARQARLLYKSDVADLSARELLSQTLKSVDGVTMTGFKNEGMRRISLINPGKNRLGAIYPIQTSDYLMLHEVAATFSGNFFSLLSYLKKIQQVNAAVYFEAIDYNVSVPPTASITIRAFTLEE